MKISNTIHSNVGAVVLNVALAYVVWMITRVVFFLVNWGALVTNFFDSVYFTYTGRRSTVSVLSEFSRENNGVTTMSIFYNSVVWKVSTFAPCFLLNDYERIKDLSELWYASDRRVARHKCRW